MDIFESIVESEFIPKISRQTILITFAGLLVPALVPYIHFGVVYSYWASYKHGVNKDSCSCTCWDTIFKGSYQEWAPGYKHVYFNVTSNTFLIWLITIVATVCSYEGTKYLLSLYINRRMRYSMFFLLLAVLYPHYYTWWSYFNAWNDEFYEQWFHQAAFSTTELVSTAIVLYLCNNMTKIKPVYLIIIMNIATSHIITGSWDQFVDNVLYQEGEWHQWTRDLAFMSVDLFHVVIPAILLYQCAQEQKISMLSYFTSQEILFSLGYIFCFWGFCAIL